MPKFSQESFSKLSTCHIDLQVIFFEVVKSFDCTVLQGFRNERDQEAAFNAGNTKLHWPFGKHNSQPSFAVDVSPYPIDFDNSKRLYWFSGYVLGIAQRLKDEGKVTHSLRWGGNWSGDHRLPEQSFNDLVHYEIVI